MFKSLTKLFGDGSEVLPDREFTALFNAILSGILVLDQDRQVVEANSSAERILGLPREKITHTKLDSHMCRGFTGLDLIWDNLLQNKEVSGGLCLERSDGLKSNFDYVLKANIIPNRYLFIFHDVQVAFDLVNQSRENSTRLEQANKFLEETKTALINVLEDFAEEKRRVEEEKIRLESVIGSIGDGVLVTSNAGIIQVLNPQAQALTRFAPVEAIGQPWAKILHLSTEVNPALVLPDLVNEVIRTGRTFKLPDRVLLTNKEGNKKPIRGSISPIIGADKKILGSVIVFSDFSRERMLEQAKDDFLSIAAHQLRTPLGALRWGMEMMLSGDIAQLPPAAKVALNSYHENVMRMITLVNDLLDVSRIDQGRIKENPQPLDIYEEVQHILEELRAEATRLHIEINLAAPASSLPKISLDRPHLTQVIENVLSNAIKYNRPGGRVDVGLELTASAIKLRVADTGIGIPQEAIAKLFNKFYRAENAALTAAEGSGLGLYVVKTYLNNWGGDIEVQSKLGRGTTVDLIIPLQPKMVPQFVQSPVPPPASGI